MNAAPVNVLAVMDRQIDVLEADCFPASAKTIREARVAVADLIEADREFDRASANWARVERADLDADEPAYQDARSWLHGTIARRAAALARCG